MKQLLKCDNKFVVRITKENAKKKYNEGREIFLIPENISPEAPHSFRSDRLLGVWINNTCNNTHIDNTAMSFEEIVSSYEMWNCKCGMAAFYIEQEDLYDAHYM